MAYDALTAVSKVGGQFELHVTPTSSYGGSEAVKNLAAVSLRLLLPNGEGGFIRIDTINGTLRHWLSNNNYTVNWGNSQKFQFPDAVIGKGLNDFVGPNIILRIMNKTGGNKVIITFYKDEKGDLVAIPRKTTTELNTQVGAMLSNIESPVAPAVSKDVYVGDEDVAQEAVDDTPPFDQ